MRPLDGIRVLDIATLVAGPYAASSLAEFGAEVLKIEKPGQGDTLRRLGTRAVADGTYWWLSDGRNKKSIELDLRTSDGAGQFRRLVREADVVIENFRPGTLEKWGLGLDQLHALNPGLIMLSVTGFGQDGPKAQLPGLARIAEGLAGFTHLTGEPGGAPLLSGASALSDYITGTFGAYGIVLALRARDQTGRGQRIDAALYDGILRYLDELVPAFCHGGLTRDRLGSETHRSVPHASYPCADGTWVAIACTNDSLFDRLALAMGQPGLSQDARFATNAQRIAHRDAINAIVRGWTQTLPRAEVERACAAHSVPCGPINAVEDVVSDEQIRHRGSLVEVPHPELGSLTVPGVVPRLSETPGRIDHLGPHLGEHNHMLEQPWTARRDRPPPGGEV